MLIKDPKSFLPLLSLLFLVIAVSVGVALSSGTNPVFTLPKAASCAQAGGSCLTLGCCPGLQASFKNGQCTCMGGDTSCGGVENGRLICSNRVIYKCSYGTKVKVKDCAAIGAYCDNVGAGLDTNCSEGGLKPAPTPKSTKVISGCGSANYPACSSGTCKAGYSCRKSGSSCGCVKNNTK